MRAARNKDKSRTGHKIMEGIKSVVLIISSVLKHEH